MSSLKNNQTKSIVTFFLLVIMLSTQTISYTCKDYNYHYHMLVLNWPYQYCYHHTCKENLKDLGVKNQWIIQGLWPASKDMDFLNCIEYNGKDPHCYVAYAYKQTAFPTSLRNDLNSYWPQISVSNNIKSTQWDMHGTCYLSIIQTLNTSTIGKQDKIFESYYTDSIKKVSNLNLTLNAEQINTKAELAKFLKLEPNQFYSLCEYDPDYLSQIRLCYDIKGVAGAESLINCPSTEPNQCQFPVKVRKSNSQLYLSMSVLVTLLFLALIN